jgi:hypothetical protein
MQFSFNNNIMSVFVFTWNINTKDVNIVLMREEYFLFGQNKNL